MKKIIIILFIMLMLIPLVSAADFVVKQDRIYDLKIPCIDGNDNFCGNDVNCTVTLNRPDGDNVVNNKNMTWNAAFYNYTFLANETTENGEHDGIMQCDGAGNSNGFDRFTILITLSGQEEEKSTLGIFIGMVIVIIVFVTLGILNKNGAWMMMSYALGFLQLVVMLFISYAMNRGADINNLLFINFMAAFIIGFGMIMLTGWRISIGVITGTEDAVEGKKWVDDGWENPKKTKLK